MDDKKNTAKTEFSGSLVSGIATFLGAPVIPPKKNSLEESGAKIGILGVPFDSTTTDRTGSLHGPRSLRHVSSFFMSYHFEYDYDLIRQGHLVDCGDVNVVPGNAEVTLNRAQEDVSEILKAGALPVLLGGEHLITVAGTRACANAATGKLGLIVLDAHMDTAPENAGEKLSHCSPISRTLDLPQFDGSHTAILGVRGALNPKNELDFIQKEGIYFRTMRQIWKQGLSSVLEEAVSVAGEGTDGVYLSLDMDALDASLVPGTGTPTAGGFLARDLFEIIEVFSKLSIVGLDVNEIAPQYDTGSVTSFVAMQFITDFLAARGSHKRE